MSVTTRELQNDYLLPVFIIFLGILGCTSSGRDGSARQKADSAPAVSASGRNPASDQFDSVAIVEMRGRKDSLFRSPQSPIPVENRSAFPGLRYYPPRRDYMVVAHFRKLEPPQPFQIVGTQGDVRVMQKIGTMEFSIGGTPCTLSAFSMEEHPSGIFLPFRDKTNGSETYEVGRYIDLERADQAASYLLDFNAAYNPYCAYNSNYTCPVVPKENILPVAIPAGEMLPGLPH